jgi:tetratricopeptide (TPR) repeat protein
MKKIYIILLFLCALLYKTRSQPAPQPKRVIDSLQQYLKTAKEDTSKCNNLNAMSTMLWQKGDYANAERFALEARALSKKLNFTKALGSSYNNTGTVFWYKANYNAALNDYITSLSIMEKIKHKAGISDASNNIGMVHYALGNYEKTIEYYKKSLDIDAEAGNKGGVALSWNNIGGVYEEIGREHRGRGDYKDAIRNIDLAEDCFRKSLKICEEENIKPGLALGYSNVGSALMEKAEIKNLEDPKVDLNPLYDSAKEFLERALAVKKEIGDINGISGTFISLGELSVQMKKYLIAEKYFNDALEIATETQAKQRILNCYRGLCSAKEGLGNFQEALRFHKLFSLVQDSIYEEDMNDEIAEMQTKYETEKKEEQIKLLDKDKEIQAAQIKEQKLIIFFVLGGLVLVFGFAGVLYNRFRVIRKQKLLIAEQKRMVDKAFEELHEKNKEITDSIYYARRIQRALVTNDKYINKHLSRLIQ